MATPEELEKLRKRAARANEAAERLRQSLLDLTRGSDEYNSALSRQYAASVKAYQQTLEFARANDESLDTINTLRGSLQEANQRLAAHKDALQAAVAAQQAYTKQAEAGYSATKNLAQQVGLMGDSWESATSSIFMTKGGLAGIFKGFTEIIKPMNLAGSVMNAVIESTIQLALEMDTASVSFNKSTGMVGMFDNNISRLRKPMIELGIHTGELYENVGLLATEIGTFTDMSDTQQDSMLRGVSVLDKFGISAQQTTNNVTTMMAAMGMSGEEAVKMQQSLFLLAEENHISANKMMSDFSAVADDMAAFGDQGVEVFADLAVAAEKSNMAVSDLLSITQKFDTFDGATEAVGRLNALLGGPFLNSLEMVMVTDPTERMRMLSDALTATGRSFQDMSYYERKAIADAAGLQSTSDLAKVMQGNFEGLSGSVMKSAEELEAMEDRSARFNTLAESTKALLMDLALEFQPVVDFAKDMIKRFQQMDPEFKSMIVKASALAVGLKLLGSIMSGSAEAGKSHAQQNRETASTLGVYITALGKVVAVGLIAIPVIKAISAAASMVAEAFQGAGDMSDMFASMQSVSLLDFTKTATGLSKISQAVNDIEGNKAIAVSTVFDSAAAMAATQTINTAAATGVTATATASPGTAQMVVTAPIELKSTIMINEREFASLVEKHDVTFRLANEIA